MKNALRGFFGLSVLLFLLGVLPGTAVPQGSSNGGGTCGAQPDDADQVDAVRAMAEEQCDCENASNHDDYVNCVEQVGEAAVEGGLLRPPCGGVVVQCAEQSTCGMPGFVTCCQTDAKGRTSCSIKQRGRDCRAPRGGTSCVGSVPSCCDACGADGSCLGSTTTTAAPTTTTTTAAPTTTTTTAAPTTTTTTAAPTTTTTTAAPTTTTTTAAPTTTTTTTLPVPMSLKFTNDPGTTSCGGAGLSPAPAAPFTGELDSDTACSTKTNDLGRGCLYIGGGNAKAIPPGAVPSGATNYLDISGSNLVASNGTGTLDCTKAAGPGKYCLNNDALTSCTNDAGCGGYTGACHETANCYFGPPLEFPNPILTSLTTCVQNVIQTDAAGMGNPSTGDSTVSLPLSSWVYVTGNITSPCPKCAGTCTYGANVGGACLSGGSTGSSQDCPPTRGGGAFQAPLSVTLNPLTTGTSTLVGASGAFCPNQKTAGAFAVTSSQCIKTVGNAAGDLTDGVPHSGAILASAFCIPTTTNSTIDGVADLPGPGLTSLPGTAQLVPTP